MTTLVIAEHDNAVLKGSTLNTITAAVQVGGDVHVLVAGSNAAAVAAAGLLMGLVAALVVVMILGGEGRGRNRQGRRRGRCEQKTLHGHVNVSDGRDEGVRPWERYD